MLWFFLKDLPLHLHREQKWNTVRNVQAAGEQSVMKQHESAVVREPSPRLFPQRDQAATLACAHYGTRHQYKHHRNKITQQAFKNFGSLSNISGSIFGGRAALLSITAPRRSHVFMWHNGESLDVTNKLQTYTVPALMRAIWDLCHMVVNIQESMSDWLMTVI